MRLGEQHNPFPFRSLLFSVLMGLLLLLLLCYVLYQARFLLLGPQVVLFDHPTPLQQTRVVELEGQVFNIVKATLNGRPLFTDESGYFKEALILENGYTIATLEAQDRYGRTTTIRRSFIYTPQSIANN